MTNFVVTQPCSLFGDDKEAVKKFVTERNANILIETSFPTNTEVLSAKTLIGNPNTAISEDVAELLSEKGVLTRVPILGDNGKQLYLKIDGVKSFLWSYSWGEKDFIDLDEPTLMQVAWDLRHCRGFFNVFNLVEEEEEDLSDAQLVEETSEVDEDFTDEDNEPSDFT